MSYDALNHYMRHLGVSNYEVHREVESSNYESGTLILADSAWHIRTARVTPKKPGAFVAVWRKNDSGRNEPFSDTDPASGLLVFVHDAEQRGVFSFPNSALVALGIFSTDSSPGKLGFRVYPAWCRGLNDQALRTQRVQAEYFESYL